MTRFVTLIIVITIVITLCTNAHAQLYGGGGGGAGSDSVRAAFTADSAKGVKTTARIRLTKGAANDPTITWEDMTSGIYYDPSNEYLEFRRQGNYWLSLAAMRFVQRAGGGPIQVIVGGYGGGPQGIVMSSLSPLVWTNGDAFPATADLFLWRSAANVLQLGTTSATPSTQTFQSATGSGTNIAGANLTIRSGAGTGDATGSSVIFSAPIPGSSGSTQQSYTEVLRLNSTGATFSIRPTGLATAAGFDANGRLGELASHPKWKKDMQPLTSLWWFKDIHTYTFTWRENTMTPNVPDIGFNSVQLASLDKRLVTYDKNGEPAGVNERALLAITIKKVQEQEQRIAALERKMSAMYIVAGSILIAGALVIIRQKSNA